jgi:hypothetical protein
LISLILLHANGNLELNSTKSEFVVHVEQPSPTVGHKMEFLGAVPIEIIMHA